MKKVFLSLLFIAVGLTCWADETEYFIVGDATPFGWVAGDARRPTQMTETSTPGIYEWTGLLKNAEGFFICNSLSGWSGYGSSVPKAEGSFPIEDVGEDECTESDNKWNPVNTDWQYYTITLDTNTGKLSWEAGKLFVADDEGYYSIGTAADLYWFSAIVNSDQSVKAKLTADIDYTAYHKGFIGTNSKRYAGTFDGQEHTVTIDIRNDATCSGLFGVVYGATIKNLVVAGNAESSQKLIGGLGGVSYGNSVIENIVVKTAISFTGSGDATCGGIFGDIEAACTVKNCAFLGSIYSAEGTNLRCLVSWCSGGVKFENCLIAPVEIGADGFDNDNLANGNYSTTNCVRVSRTDPTIATGALCYTMNGDQSEINWYQTIGTDDYPVPFSSHGQVYANGELKCDGTSAGGDLVYSNSATTTVPPHTDVDGWCSVCHSFLENHLTADSEGFYSIGNAADLYWFATLAKDVNQSAKAKLTADIDYTTYPQGFIGIGNAFKGMFDGQEHTVTIALVSDAKIRGLFASIDGATIKDLVVEGSITSDYNNIGGLGGQASGNSTVENVVVKTAISFTPGSGDASIGGFFPYIPNGSVAFKNCAFYGSVMAGTASGNAGMVGWNSGSIQASNCIIAPVTIEADEFKDYTRGNNPTTTNCVRVDVNDAKLATGEFCYTMNGNQEEINWYQTIGTDNFPVPFSSHGQVYANGELKCDGTSAGGDLVYSNSNESVIPPHTNVNGWCTVCGTLDQNYLTADSEGFYPIGNATDLYWFAAVVKEVNQSAKAKLTDDIDYTAYPKGFIGVGKAFSGTFDGQQHSVTIALESDAKIRGLFAGINGATIKNLVVDGRITSEYNNIGGLGGQADGSNTIENVVVKTTINFKPESGDASIGGFFPYINSGTTTFANCAFYGSVKAGTANGNAGLVSWSSGSCQAETCLIAPAEIEASAFDDYARGGKTVSDCYSVTSDDARLASGELCYLLNGSTCYDAVWTQTIGTDDLPVPFATQGIVSQITSAGYATLFIPTTDVIIPAGVQAFTGKISGDALILTALEGTISKDDAVVLKGSEGFYSFIPTTGASPAAENDLIAATTETTADGTQFILANGEYGVGFYKVEDGTNIPAGKAYLAVAGGIKAFFGFDGDANGIEMVNESMMNSPVYNLAGQKLFKFQKGINIVNGKKVVIK